MSEPSPKNAKALIRAEELKHSFEEGDSVVQALRGVSFEARTREVTAVIGQSGCGKSTLLYLLGLLDRPQSGEIYLKGRPMAKASNEERTALRNETIGFVFQFHFLIKELTARENVALPLRKSGVGEKEALDRAGELLDRLGLGNKTNRFANKLSGGEQQRVAIARSPRKLTLASPCRRTHGKFGQRELGKRIRTPHAICPGAGNCDLACHTQPRTS